MIPYFQQTHPYRTETIEIIDLHSPPPTTSKLKKHWCYYCDRFITKIWRHVQRIHKNENLVKYAYCNDDVTMKEKNAAAQLIRNLGNYKYNMNILSSGCNTDDLIVARDCQGVKREN